MANDKSLYGHHMESTVTLHGVPVEVEYTYYPAIEATDDEPPTDADIEIDAVMLDGFDIQRMLGENTWDKLYDELFKIVKQMKEDK